MVICLVNTSLAVVLLQPIVTDPTCLKQTFDWTSFVRIKRTSKRRETDNNYLLPD